MSSYIINFSDPLRSEFSIPPGSFDGPGGVTSHTSLRLFGRGSLEWGESVDENLIRLSENFAGATVPVTPVAGQLWLRQKLYWHNTATNTFFRYSFTDNAWHDDTPGPNVFPAPTPVVSLPVSGTIGSYVWNTVTSKLYRWDSIYKQGTPTWLERQITASTSNPGSAVPEQTLLVYDQFSSDWTSPATVVTSSPLYPQNGQFRLDPVTGNLYIWNNGAWQQLFGPGTTGVPSPVNPGDAVNLAYANTNYINTSGDTMTGALILNADPVTALGAATKQYVDNNFINKNGSVAMTGELTLLNSTPSTALKAASKGYVDSQVSGISSNPAIPAIYASIGTGSPKSGDIAVVGSTIYINAGGGLGNWKQVFPAVYS